MNARGPIFCSPVLKFQFRHVPKYKTSPGVFEPTYPVIVMAREDIRVAVAIDIDWSYTLKPFGA